MRLVDLIPAPCRLFAIGVLLAAIAGGSAALAWQIQDWRYGQQLERQARLHTDTLSQIVLASAAKQRNEQGDPPPPPAAWFMAPQEPTLTQCMLNELSALPMPATKD